MGDLGFDGNRNGKTHGIALVATTSRRTAYGPPSLIQ